MKKILVFFIVFYNIQLYGSDCIITKMGPCPGGYTVTINEENKIIGENRLESLINNSQQPEIRNNKERILELLQKDTVTIVSEQYWEKLNQAAYDAKVKFNKNNPQKHFFILEKLGSKGHKRGLKLH